MDAKEIRCFQMVFEEQSVNKAAKHLFITPQGLSKIIAHLESELDCQLFLRSPKGMIPTEIYRCPVNAIVYPGHPFYELSQLSIEDLKNQPIICLNERFSMYHNFIRRCADFGFVPDIVFKTIESQLIYRFCQDKMGIGIDVNIHHNDRLLGDFFQIIHTYQLFVDRCFSFVDMQSY